MIESHVTKVAGELGLNGKQVRAVSDLLDQGSTVPFIARYRKETTGSLDEVAIAAIRDRMTQLRELDKRRESILKTLAEGGQLTEELRAQNPDRRNHGPSGRRLSSVQAKASNQIHGGSGKRPRASGKNDLCSGLLGPGC